MATMLIDTIEAAVRELRWLRHGLPVMDRALRALEGAARNLAVIPVSAAELARRGCDGLLLCARRAELDGCVETARNIRRAYCVISAALSA